MHPIVGDVVPKYRTSTHGKASNREMPLLRAACCVLLRNVPLVVYTTSPCNWCWHLQRSLRPVPGGLAEVVSKHLFIIHAYVRTYYK